MEEKTIIEEAYRKIPVMTDKIVIAIVKMLPSTPLGMRELTPKEMIENYLRLTLQEHAMLLQKYGPEQYKKYVDEMERLISKSEKATLRAYGLEEV